jgi:hypothetical protein
MILANFGASAAMTALRLIYLRDSYDHILAPGEFGLQEQVSVRLLYIAIQEQEGTIAQQ